MENLTDDVVSAVGAGVMLQQPGVHAFLVEAVSTRDNPQLLRGEGKGVGGGASFMMSKGMMENSKERSLDSFRSKTEPHSEVKSIKKSPTF